MKSTLGCVQSRGRYKNEKGAKACCLSIITTTTWAPELISPGSGVTRYSGAAGRDLNTNDGLPGFRSPGGHLEQCGLGLIVPVFLAVPPFPCASIYWSAPHTSGGMSGPRRASLTITCPVSVPPG